MKIAVFLDEQGHTLSLGQPGLITLFTREGATWQRSDALPFALSWQNGLAEIRQQTFSMLAALPDCHHLVAREIHGALLAWLDGMGFTLWQCQGEPQRFLDHIARQIESTTTSAVVIPLSGAVIQPTETSGEYRLDLINALHHSNGGHTSKNLLVPFFERHAFSRLQIVCDHVPKWFVDLATWQLTAEVETQPDGTLHITVTPLPATDVPCGTNATVAVRK